MENIEEYDFNEKPVVLPKKLQTINPIPVSREEFDSLTEMVYRLSKTMEGIQQLFIRAGEYQGKPRGRLPR